MIDINFVILVGVVAVCVCFKYFVQIGTNAATIIASTINVLLALSFVFVWIWGLVLLPGWWKLLGILVVPSWYVVVEKVIALLGWT